MSIQTKTATESQFHTECPLCGSANLRKTQGFKNFKGRDWRLDRCLDCTLHFTQPAPSMDEIYSFYAGDYHSNLREVGATERQYGPKYDRYATWLESVLPAGRVVDVGCATGLLVKKFNEFGYQAEGVELDQASAAWGIENYHVKIHTQPLEECPFEEGSLDGITLTDVVEHSSNPKVFVRHVAKLLRTGGYALITFPDILAVESRYLNFMGKVLGRPWVWMNCRTPKHIWEFSYRSAKETFNQAGLKIVGYRRAHIPLPKDAPLWLRILHSPLLPLRIPPITQKFGTQMEFLLQKEN